MLDWTGPITAGELARRVGITSGAVTGVIDRLGARRVGPPGSDPTDRRRVIVELIYEPPDGPAAREMEELFTPLQQDDGRRSTTASTTTSWRPSSTGCRRPTTPSSAPPTASASR